MNEDYIAIEALEVLIHHILFIRDVYPKEIFQRRKMYNSPVFMSIYPHLNDYLAKVLNIARILKAEKQLNKVELLIYKDQKCVYETYAFDITNETNIDTSKDQYLMDLEDQLRTTLYTLSERLMQFEKLPEDVGVKLQLYTNQSTYIKISKDLCKDIPWMQVSKPNKDAREQAKLPLMNLTECGINVLVEI